MNSKKLIGLAKKYVIWPELHNDSQKNIDFSGIKVADFEKEIKELNKNPRKPIDGQIALFYLANEKLSYSRINSQDVLGVNELKDYEFYQHTLNQLSKELLAYILVCCLVEARHNRMLNSLDYEWRDYLAREKQDGTNIFDKTYHREQLEVINTHPSGDDFLRKYMVKFAEDLPSKESLDKYIKFNVIISDNLPNKFNKNSRDIGYKAISENFLTEDLKEYTISEVLNYLKILFKNAYFQSNDYGGQAWSTIAEHGLNFVQGKMNAEMFIDQAFSLEHNSGNMFNKSYLFKISKKFQLNFSNEDKGYTNSVTMWLKLNDIILNAQHLGIIGGLFNLDKQYRKMKAMPVETLYQELYNENKLMGISKAAFIKMHEDILINYKEIVSQLKEVKKNINAVSPHLLKMPENQTVDLKKIFMESAKRNGYSRLFTQMSEEKGLIDMWCYLNNEKFNSSAEIRKVKPFNFEVYDVEQLPIEKYHKDIIGGKAWGLVNMVNLGLPIPKAKVFSTDCCHSYHNHPEKFSLELENSLSLLNDYLIDKNKNPILCSIRSGAPVSMPGMMDTVLNVGIDDSNYDYFKRTLGSKVTSECAIKFMTLFCASRLNENIEFPQNIKKSLKLFKEILEKKNIKVEHNAMFPLDKEAQIKESLIAVFNSWDSERAVAYRTEKKISHDLGTAAIIQQMVFGNLNKKSCTGVVFSRDCLTGENKLVGEFLPKAQGEDVVSGSVTPFPIEQFKQFDPKSYNELELITKQLEQQTGQIQDIEFTVENGQLYILQHRQAVCSPIAAVKMLEDSSLDKTLFLKQINPKMLQKSHTVQTIEKPVVEGLSGNSGVITGMVILEEVDMLVCEEDFKKQKSLNPNFGWIFYAELTSPEHMPLMNKTQAFITEQGGFTSHAAIIARSLNKPCIVGLGGDKAERFTLGDIITIDATNGKIWKNEQNIVEDETLAKSAANLFLESKKIKINEIDKKIFKERVNQINKSNRSWTFKYPETKYVNIKPKKFDKFLDIGQRMAIALAAEERIIKKVRIK